MEEAEAPPTQECRAPMSTDRSQLHSPCQQVLPSRWNGQRQRRPKRKRTAVNICLPDSKLYFQTQLQSHIKSVYICRYLDDFYELELQAQSGVKGWNLPETKGGGPSARESHSSVVYTGKGGSSPKLFVFGGMCGHRLNDLWQLDLGNSDFYSVKTSSCMSCVYIVVIWPSCCSDFHPF